MQIFTQKELNGLSMYFLLDSSEFNSIFLNIMALFPNNVIKVSSDNGKYYVVLDLITEKEKETAINYFKEKGLYMDINPINCITPENIKKEFFHPDEKYKEFMVDRVFNLHGMPDKKLNGLTPLSALYQYKDEAFIAMFLNYPFFQNTEKIFVAEACKMYLQKELKVKNIDTFTENQAKDFLLKYQSLYFNILKDILKNKYKNIGEFCQYENLTSLRDACKTVSQYLENIMEK